MLSDYSSFLEFVAGIYATICFDDILNNIWSSKYYDNTKKIFKSIKVDYYPELSEHLIKKNQEWIETLKKPMIKRAAFMIFMLMLSLLYVGFESVLAQNNDNMLRVQMAIEVILVFVLLFYFILFRRIVFTSWSYLTFGIVLLFPSFYVALKIAEIITIPLDYPKTLFIPIFLSFVLIPICWQLFSSWVYSYLYSGHIRNKLSKELFEYQNAISLLGEKDKTQLPEKYKSLFTESFLKDSEKANDACLDLFNELLISQLINSCRPANVFSIIISSIKFQVKLLFKKVNKPVEINHVGVMGTNQLLGIYSIPQEFKKNTTVQVSLDYEQEFQGYLLEKKKRGKLGLKDYCKGQNLNFNEMKIWLDNRNAGKTGKHFNK